MLKQIKDKFANTKGFLKRLEDNTPYTSNISSMKNEESNDETLSSVPSIPIRPSKARYRVGDTKSKHTAHKI